MKTALIGAVHPRWSFDLGEFDLVLPMDTYMAVEDWTLLNDCKIREQTSDFMLVVGSERSTQFFICFGEYRDHLIYVGHGKKWLTPNADHGFHDHTGDLSVKPDIEASSAFVS